MNKNGKRPTWFRLYRELLEDNARTNKELMEVKADRDKWRQDCLDEHKRANMLGDVNINKYVINVLDEFNDNNQNYDVSIKCYENKFIVWMKYQDLIVEERTMNNINEIGLRETLQRMQIGVRLDYLNDSGLFD